jgi:GrpB-like predicted nucleotidyltransferase (UPF0157 family)
MSGPTAEPSARGLLGLDKSEVRLVPYDPGWAALGEQERATVQALLGALAVQVIHAGSTAVPGIDAKPILDIAAAVGDRVLIDEVVAALCATGAYAYEGDQGTDGGLLFVRGTGEFRTVHVHVVGTGSQAWLDYRRFHALLVRDAAARHRYESVKRELARQFPHDRRAYTRAKSTVIQELLAAEGPSAAGQAN